MFPNKPTDHCFIRVKCYRHALLDFVKLFSSLKLVGIFVTALLCLGSFEIPGDYSVLCLKVQKWGNKMQSSRSAMRLYAENSKDF